MAHQASRVEREVSSSAKIIQQALEAGLLLTVSETRDVFEAIGDPKTTPGIHYMFDRGFLRGIQVGRSKFIWRDSIPDPTKYEPDDDELAEMEQARNG